MCCLLNLLLVCGGSATIAISGVGGRFNADPVLDVWLWVFAFPIQAAHSLGWDSLALALLFVNPFIYGLVWWFLWKMLRLMRAKPADDEPLPPNDQAESLES